MDVKTAKYIIICLILIIVGCTSSQKKYDGLEYERIRDSLINKMDSVYSSSEKKEQNNKKEPVKKNTYKELEPWESPYDNLRGWDPAFEDDMEDMAITRYLENNDDIGWY